jgi:hypothetical protein
MLTAAYCSGRPSPEAIINLMPSNAISSTHVEIVSQSLHYETSFPKPIPQSLVCTMPYGSSFNLSTMIRHLSGECWCVEDQDPGGEPLDRLIGPLMGVETCLRLAVALSAVLG